MRSFKVILMPEAQADIKRLNPAIQTRILDKLDWMGGNAELLHHQALRGEEWSGCFKYRVGDYRIIVEKCINDTVHLALCSPLFTVTKNGS